MDIKQVCKVREYYPNDGWRTTQAELQGLISINFQKLKDTL